MTRQNIERPIHSGAEATVPEETVKALDAVAAPTEVITLNYGERNHLPRRVIVRKKKIKIEEDQQPSLELEDGEINETS
jgi:hypothetical protein